MELSSQHSYCLILGNKYTLGLSVVIYQEVEQEYYHEFFTSYNHLTNSEYITVSGQHKIPVEVIGSAYLIVILLYDTFILILLDTLHMLIFDTNLVSLSVIQCKEALVRS